MGVVKRVKTIFWVLVGIVCLLGVIHIARGFLVDRKMTYKEVPVYSPKIPQELDGYKIAFVSDIHSYSIEKLDLIVEEIRDWNPDLMLLGGDFYNKKHTLQAIETLARVSPTDGICGVEGTHDRRNGLFKAMEQYGMMPLINEGTQIRPGLYVAGIKDYHTKLADVQQAVEKAPEDDFVLLVSHNPDASMMGNNTGVDMMVSGHTHGGEITFFGLWAPAVYTVSYYGQKFVSGWAEGNNGVPVYVSRGVGSHSGLRMFAPPEVTFFTLHSGEDAA